MEFMDVPLHCFVEIPKGSRNKYEWDEALGGIKLDNSMVGKFFRWNRTLMVKLLVPRNPSALR